MSEEITLDDFDVVDELGDPFASEGDLSILKRYDTLFDFKLAEEKQKLDPYQADACSVPPDKPLRIIANAGSGKTRVVIVKTLISIFDHGIDPREIVLITFTNKAAREIRSRYLDFFRDIVSDNDLKNLPTPAISTIHSFGYKAFSSLGGVRKTFLGDDKSIEIIREAFKSVLEVTKVSYGEARRVMEQILDLYARNEMHLLFYVSLSESGRLLGVHNYDDALKMFPDQIRQLNRLTFSYASNTGESGGNPFDSHDEILRLASETVQECARQCALGENTFLSIVKRYLEYKYSCNSMDFSDCMYIPQLMCIQHPRFRERVQERYKYFFVDESQDNDTLNFSLVKVLSENHNITLVGDPKQTLFTWRNAQPELMLKLEHLIEKDVVEKSLLRNYRSPKQHVILSNIFSESFRDFEVSPSEPVKGLGKNCLSMKKFPSTKSELNFIAKEIIDLKTAGYKYSDMTILSRTNKSLMPIEACLISHGIPNIPKHDSRSITKQSTFKFVYSLYSLLLNPQDINSFTEVLSNAKKIGEKFNSKIHSQFMENIERNKSFTIYDINANTFTLTPGQSSIMMAILDDIIKPLKEYFKRVNVTFEEINDKLRSLIVEKAGLLSSKDNSKKKFLFLFEERQLDKVLQVYKAIYYSMKDDGRFTGSSTENFIKIYEALQLSMNPDDVQDKKDRVLITTIHAFKGRESKVIFYSNLNRLMQTPSDAVEEERCCFYVGVTRSTDRMYLTRSSEVMDEKGQPRKAVENMFLERYIEGIEEMKEILSKDSGS